MRYISSVVFSISLVLIFSCSEETTDSRDMTRNDVKRPLDTWVFRSALEDQSHMITLALHDDLWVSYDTVDCIIYNAWNGDLDLNEGVQISDPDFQPTTISSSYIKPTDQEWMIRENGAFSPTKIQYTGHEIKDNRAYLKYTLIDQKGRLMYIKESPEYFRNGSQSGFVRYFTTSDVPVGVDIVLHTTISSITSASSIITNGAFEQTSSTRLYSNNLTGLSLEGHLVMNSNLETEVKAIFARKPLISNALVGGEVVPEGEKLINRSDCKTCHHAYRNTVGPAYIEVARRYRNTEANIAMLVTKIKNGGAGTWGPAAMSPHPKLSDKVLTKMVSYIMQLDAEEE